MFPRQRSSPLLTRRSERDAQRPEAAADETPKKDPLISLLNRAIHLAVRALALMMTVVIVLGVVDVGWTLHQKAMAPPRYVLTIGDILATFGAFMAVLIAIEIFENITLYLRDDVIHVKIVMATALMAIARKVIILDFNELSPAYILATAAVVFAMSLGYWLVVKFGEAEEDVQDAPGELAKRSDA